MHYAGCLSNRLYLRSYTSSSVVVAAAAAAYWKCQGFSIIQIEVINVHTKSNETTYLHTRLLYVFTYVN